MAVFKLITIQRKIKIRITKCKQIFSAINLSTRIKKVCSSWGSRKRKPKSFTNLYHVVKDNEKENVFTCKPKKTV